MLLKSLFHKQLIHWLANRAESCYAQRRWRLARLGYQIVSRVDSKNRFATLRLGQIAKARGELAAAEQYWRAALTLDASQHEAAMAASYELNELGQQAVAEQFLREYRQRFPADVSCRRLLADICSSSDRYVEAAQLLVEVQRDCPSDPTLLPVVAQALRRGGEMRAAVAYYERYVQASPSDVTELKRFGDVLLALGEYPRAQAIFQQVLALQPEDPQALTNLGSAYYRLGRITDATSSLSQAIRIAPAAVHAYINLGVLFFQQGRLAAAERILRRARTLPLASGVDAVLQSNALYLMNLLPNVTETEVANAHRAWGVAMAHWARPLGTVDHNPQRSLRLGFVSPDFRKHSVFYFLAPLFANRVREFEYCCYSDVEKPDECTAWFQSRVDQWRDVHALSDEQLWATIRADRIDILFDLAGHTAGNRLGVFARRAAPVQMTYLGYPNGTGLAIMDYRLTDARADPPSADPYHVERLLRLPESFLCYRPPSDAPLIAPARILARDDVTFGSFNNLAKVNEQVLRVWCEILRRLPNAQLVLKAKSFSDEHVCERYRRYFCRQKIDPARIQMTGWTQEVGHHLASYNAIDIALDTFPYNGTTTTCEALHMGVPVIALVGSRHAGRVGASILGRLGLSELLATTEEDYIKCAVRLASSPARLDAYRHTLRQQLHDLLGNEVAFAADFAATLRSTWQRWCVTKH